MRSRRFVLPFLFILAAAPICRGESPSESGSAPTFTLGGYLKSLNTLARSTGLNTALIDDPDADPSTSGVQRFQSLERLRLKMRSLWAPSERQNLALMIEYDHTPSFGTQTGSGDAQYGRAINEKRQYYDLIWKLGEDENAYYEHQFYRFYLAYQLETLRVKFGRQQIPWGVGYFFTPTDVFNPLYSVQLELDERQGVDAIHVSGTIFEKTNWELVYTPDGRSLHPERYMARLSRDFYGYETGVLGGLVDADPAIGFDLRGNVGDSAMRSECLYVEPDTGKSFVKCSVNGDYNFPGSVYASLEYFFNGEGSRDKDSYEFDRFVAGEIQQLAKNYLGLILGHDLSPLLRLEYRQLFNIDDGGLFFRPEIIYSVQDNLELSFGSQLFSADNDDEYDEAQPLVFFQGKYSF